MHFGNPCGDPFGQTLPYCWILKSGILLEVGDEAHLHQCCRAKIMVQHIIVARFHPPAVGAIAAGDLTQDIRGKGGGMGVIVIGLHSRCRSAGCPVAVNTDKGRVGMGVGDGGAHPKRDEDIGVACHDDMIAPPLELRLQALGDVERQHLLIHPPHGMGPVIIAPVAGIDHDCAEAGEIRPGVKEGASRQKDQGQEGKEAESPDAEQGHGLAQEHDDYGI